MSFQNTALVFILGITDYQIPRFNESIINCNIENFFFASHFFAYRLRVNHLPVRQNFFTYISHISTIPCFGGMAFSFPIYLPAQKGKPSVTGFIMDTVCTVH